MANLAMAESEAGDHTKALKHINTAVAHLDAASPDGIISRRKRAEILARAGRIAESRAAFGRYFDSERRLLLDNLDEMTPSQRLNYWTKVKPLLLHPRRRGRRLPLRRRHVPPPDLAHRHARHTHPAPSALDDIGHSAPLARVRRGRSRDSKL